MKPPSFSTSAVGVVLTLAAAATCVSSTDTKPLLELDGQFSDTDNLVCGQAISTGQQAGMCGIVGSGYPMQSAAGFFAAARFQDFELTAPAVSSEQNVPGILADVVLEVSRSSSRPDAAKGISGTAQVDLFLCVDEACTVVADLMNVLPESATQSASSDEDAAAAAVLAIGYLRLPLSSAGLPTRYVSSDTTSIKSQLHGNVSLPSGSGDSTPMTATQVSWTTPDNAQYLYGNPVLMQLGAMTRLFTLGEERENLDWGLLRMGNYWSLGVQGTSELECVTIISFKHAFMDRRGWGKSDDCTPTSTYIFSSYMTEAMLEWPYIDDGDYSDAGNETVTNYIFNLRTAASGTDTSYAKYTALPPAEDAPTSDQFGACMVCPDDMFANVESTAVAGQHTCTPKLHRDCEDPTPEDNTLRSVLTLGAAGGAVIAAWDITEALQGPDAQNLLYGTTYAGSDGEGVQYRALQPLVALAVMATSSDGLPWCQDDVTDASSFSRARGSLAISSLVGPEGGPLLLADCKNWEALGLGAVWPEGKEPSGDAASGAAMRNLMTPTLVVMDGSTVDRAGLIYGAQLISGYESIVFDTLRSGIDNVVATAAVLLNQGVAAELAVTDELLTPYGALVNIVLTFVAVLATYTSRKDLVKVLGRAVPLRAARALAAVLCAFTITAPAVLLVLAQSEAVASNADGSESTLAWAQAYALGAGQYRVVGLVSMSYTSPPDTAAMVLMYVNLVLAVVGALVVFVATVRGSKSGKAAAAAATATAAAAQEGTSEPGALVSAADGARVKEVDTPTRRLSRAPLGGGLAEDRV